LDTYWSKVFKDYREAKLVVLEWDKERRGKYESIENWDKLISMMYKIEISSLDDKIKISKLMSYLSQFLLVTTEQYPKFWILDNVNETKNKIKYYRNNPEEE